MFASVAAIMVAVTPAAAQKKANVVMLMSDDTGWADLGAYLGGAALEPPKSPVTSARESAEVGRHLRELQVPAMRGVHASPNYVATAVVLVRIVGVRVIATAISIRVPISIRVTGGVVVIVVTEAEAAAPEVAISEAAAPEIAIMESTTTKFAESTTTAAETTIMECHSTTAEAAMEATAAKAAAMKTATTEATAMETATTEAAAMASAHAATSAVAATASAATTATTSQRHRWRSQANRCNGQ
jgi:hypothetical protein